MSGRRSRPAIAALCACLLVLAGCASPFALGDSGTAATETSDAAGTTQSTTGPSSDTDSGSGANGTPTATFVVDGECRATVTLEVADAPAERERGLMYRRSLARNHGMAFIYEEARRLSFWMKNTYVPLDIVFVGPDGRVLNVAHATPQPNASESELRRYRSDVPATYAIELRRGFANRTGVGPGARVRFSNATFETPDPNERPPISSSVRSP